MAAVRYRRSGRGSDRMQSDDAQVILKSYPEAVVHSLDLEMSMRGLMLPSRLDPGLKAGSLVACAGPMTARPEWDLEHDQFTPGTRSHLWCRREGRGHPGLNCCFQAKALSGGGIAAALRRCLTRQDFHMHIYGHNDHIVGNQRRWPCIFMRWLNNGVPYAAMLQ